MSVKLKIGTLDLRAPVKKDEIHDPSNRRKCVLSVIEREKPDLVGSPYVEFE